MVHIDYLSLTDKGANLNNEQQVIAQMDTMLAFELSKLWVVEGGIWGHGRAPYRYSYRVFGASLFFNIGKDGVLLELTGQGCEKVREYLPSIITQGHVTRIDIAHDIETALTPFDVLTKRPSATFDTPTGQTAYIGSMKSDTMTRVYRYAPPHPRSDTMRVEHVFRRGLAQKVATDYATGGDESLINWFMTRTKKQGITHPLVDWNYKKQTFSSGDRKQNGGVTWYKRQVLPALKRMVRHGLLSLDQIIKDMEHGRNS